MAALSNCRGPHMREQELLARAVLASFTRGKAERDSDPMYLPRLLLAAAEDRTARDFRREWERSQQIAEELGRPPTPGTIYVDTRTLTAGVAQSGGDLVGIGVPPVFGESALDPGLVDRLGVQRI